MKMNKESSQYFEWLKDIVNADEHPFERLLTLLYSSEFTWSVPHDENRVSDGLDLRTKFCNDFDISIDKINKTVGPCTVLEVMVAMAMRCEEDIMQDPAYGDRTSLWFWTMVENLGLEYITDDDWDEGFAKYVIFNFVNRKFRKNGQGSLWCTRTGKDVRKMDLSMAMNTYLAENYPEAFDIFG